jgi:hypothetical protein
MNISLHVELRYGEPVKHVTTVSALHAVPQAISGFLSDALME